MRGPDGTVLREDTSCGKLCTPDPITLPASGTYTILFDPRKALAGAGSARRTGVRFARVHGKGAEHRIAHPTELAGGPGPCRHR
ncbi:hypothetical protein [Nonomuraea rubra]|uniref:hypothetical protein n=1 Tax=Nonomuraea rubra TaxID=46180 RepID=UPI0033F30018